MRKGLVLSAVLFVLALTTIFCWSRFVASGRPEGEAGQDSRNEDAAIGAGNKNQNENQGDTADSRGLKKKRKEERRRRRIELLERSLSSEKDDAERTQQMTRAIEQMLGSSSFEGTLLSSIRCVETFCKATLAHEDERARDEFWESGALMSDFWRTNQFGTSEKTQEKVHFHVYFSKEGEKLPRLNERKERIAMDRKEEP